MAAAVVEMFEMIDVYHQKGKHEFELLTAADLPLEPVQKMPAHVHAGQAVGDRQSLDALEQLEPLHFLHKTFDEDGQQQAVIRLDARENQRGKDLFLERDRVRAAGALSVFLEMD